MTPDQFRTGEMILLAKQKGLITHTEALRAFARYLNLHFG